MQIWKVSYSTIINNQPTFNNIYYPPHFISRLFYTFAEIIAFQTLSNSKKIT